MFRRSARFALVLAAALATTALTSPSQALPLTALLPEHGPVVPLKNAAMINITKDGFRYRAGQQDSRLVVKEVRGRLHFIDRGTKELRSLPGSCRREKVNTGIAASCPVPAKYTAKNPMFLEIWPRLGDDRINGRTLPASYRMWVLADAGDDVVRLGAGDDFVNGAQGNDKVFGGRGDDWMRTGIGNDKIRGNRGNDKLVGVAGHDVVRGGAGNDQVGGGPGNDLLVAGAGTDKVRCGGGRDKARVQRSDKAVDCEAVSRRG